MCTFTRCMGKTIAFVRDKAGVSAVEFALVLPFMLLLLFGSTELLQVVLIDRQVTLTASTVANIVAQYTTISASQDMPDVLNASVQIFSPNPSSNAQVVVSLVTIDSRGNATVTWSQTLNGTARRTGAVVTVPASLKIPNTSLVFSEVAYSYVPVFDFLHFGTFSLYELVFMGPREATTINLTA